MSATGLLLLLGIIALPLGVVAAIRIEEWRGRQVSKFIVEFIDQHKNDVVKADYHVLSGGVVTFYKNARCEHETSDTVAVYKADLVRSVRRPE